MDAAVSPRSPAGRRRSDQTHEFHGRAVVVDASGRRLALGGLTRELKWWRGRRSILPAYLDLVMSARGMGPSSQLPLRSADLSSLGAVLAVPSGTVQVQLRSTLRRTVAGTRQNVLTRTVLPAAGAATAAGAGSALYLSMRSEVPADAPQSSLAVLEVVGQAAPATTAPAPTLAVPGTPVTEPGPEPTDTAPPDTSAPVDNSAALPDAVPSGAAAVEQLGTARYEQVGQSALQLLTYDWQAELPGWTIEFLPGREGLLGYAFFDERRIEVYVRDTHTPENVAATVAHEIGHAVDVTHLTTEERELWLDTRGIDVPWWPTETTSDYASGAGDWAEAFSVWQVGEISRSRVAEQPTAEEIRLLIRLSED